MPDVVVGAQIFCQGNACFEPISADEVGQLAGEGGIAEFLTDLLTDSPSRDRAGHGSLFAFDQSGIETLQLTGISADLLFQQLQGVIDRRLARKILQASLNDLADSVDRRSRALAQIRGPASEALVKGVEQTVQGVGARSEKPILGACKGCCQRSDRQQ